MPRVCTICNHPERPALDAAIVTGDSLRDIARQFRVSKDAVARHRTGCVAQVVAKASEADDLTAGQNVVAELRRCAERLHLLFDACDEWLRDADNPKKYDIGPRSEEVAVTYLISHGEGRPARKKAKLSELLARVDGQFEVDRAETKYADPRELVLKTYDRIQGQLELVAKLIGQLNEAPQVSINLHVGQLQAIILAALHPYPEARQAVATALAQSEM